MGTTERIDRSSDLSQPLENLSADEALKAGSDQLRGTIALGLLDELTGAVPGNDPKLMKFHGIYQQDDRDLRDERRRQKLEPAYQFMVRVWLPGGVCTPAQWLKLDSSLARARLGWTPRWDLEDGLERTVAWHRSHRDGADLREATLTQLREFGS